MLFLLETQEHAIKWLQLANTHMEAAKTLFVNINPRPLEMICCHAHQSAEKSLKAFLFYRNQTPPAVTDLPALGELCVKVDGSFADLTFLCESLNRYNELSMDPFQFDISDAEAEIAMKRALEIFMFVNKKIR